ncbi:MAG: 3-phosphoglycerate dehydrogenase, partial [Acholeplasmataceae bacterium]|nr:3-phosphoglycerate dehydrogenase [Acholeplasmataceae bacterium]
HCLNKISQVGLEILPETYVQTDDMKESHAILVRSAQMHDLTLNPKTLAVARAGAGVNNIPLTGYADTGVVVFNTPGANANAVKELTIAGMFLASRNIYQGIQWVKENQTDPEIKKTVEKVKSQFAGTEVLNKTLGIVGLGAIGIMLANAAAKLGMKVIGTKRNLDSLKNLDFHDNVTLVKTQAEVYEKADFVSLNLPLNDNTKHMVNEQVFNQMKDGVIILNFARDQLVNDDDLEKALQSQKVRAYVTDFPNAKTAQMAGVIPIPHLGASTEEAEDNCAMMAAAQIQNYLEIGTIKNSVNYPDIALDNKTVPYRFQFLIGGSEDEFTTLKGNILAFFKEDNTHTDAFYNNYGVFVVDTKENVDLNLFNDLKGIKRIRLL